MNRSLFHTTKVILLLIILGSAWSFNLAQVAAGTDSATEAAAACPLTLTYGDTVQCSIDLAGETDSFTFSGSAGDQIRVRVIETSGTLSAFQEIIRPGGTTLCDTIIGEMTCLLENNGSHTLFVNDFGGTDTGNYSVYIQRLNEPAGCNTISFGAIPTTGTIGTAAENDCFTFNAAVGDQLRARVVDTSGALSSFQEIVRPDGTTLCDTIISSMTCLADANGAYTILVKDFGGTSTGNYSLYLQRLNDPVGCATITFSGVPTSGAINVAAETDCFIFSSEVDKQIRVRAVRTSGNVSPYKEVVRPDGTTLCETIVSEVTCQLDADGRHTILIYDFAGTNSGNYQLTLICLTQPCGPPLSYSVYLPILLRP